MDKRRLIFTAISLLSSAGVYTYGLSYNIIYPVFVFLPFLIAFLISEPSERKYLKKFALNFRATGIAYLSAVLTVLLTWLFCLVSGISTIQFPEIPSYMQKHLSFSGVGNREFIILSALGALILSPSLFIIPFFPSELAWRSWFTGDARKNLILSAFFWAVYMTLIFASSHYLKDILLWFIYYFSLGFTATSIYRWGANPFSGALFISTYLSLDAFAWLFLRTNMNVLAGPHGIIKSLFLFLTSLPFLKKTPSQPQ